jgi:hypothetical protein
MVISQLCARRFRGMEQRRVAAFPSIRTLDPGTFLSGWKTHALAESRNTTVSRLLNEAATQLINEFHVETRIHLRAARGAGQTGRGLALLDQAQGREG